MKPTPELIALVAAWREEAQGGWRDAARFKKDGMPHIAAFTKGQATMLAHCAEQLEQTFATEAVDAMLAASVAAGEAA